jgi:ABC-type multidrug transport system fused ATPase/permease subunit
MSEKLKNTRPFALFCRYARNHKNAIILLTMAYIASTALLVLAPQTLSLFIDSVHSGSNWHGVALAIALYLAAMVAWAAMNAILDYQLASVGQRMTDEHRRDIMSHFMSLDAERLSGLTSGEIITRLNQDAPGLFDYHYILFYKLAGSALALVGILISLSFRVGWLSSVLLVVCILAIWGFKAIQDRGIPKYVRKSKAAASFNGLLKETLDNAPALRALTAESHAEKQAQEAMKTRFRESFPANLMYANLWSASTVMQAIVTASGLLLALFLWDAGSISLGAAYLIYTYCELIISPLQDFRNHMGNMQGAKAGILRSAEFLELPLAAHEGTSSLK